MPTLADNSADKSWEALWTLGQADQHALVDYAFELQAEVRRLRDAAAQNSHNSSRPPSTVTVWRRRLTVRGAGVAGWQGETTIISIPHNPTPPDRKSTV